MGGVDHSDRGEAECDTGICQWVGVSGIVVGLVFSIVLACRDRRLVLISFAVWILCLTA